MPSILRKTEAMLLMAFTALIAVAISAPPLLQPVQYLDFADHRMADVWSNLPFVLAGVASLGLLWTAPSRALTNMQRAMVFLFGGGLVLLAIASAGFHMAPNDTSLAANRYCLAVAMSGLLGLIASAHVSERAGAAVGMTALYGGLLAVKAWVVTGNTMPWGVFQFGTLLLMMWMATLPPLMRALPVKWAMVFCACFAATLLGLNDYPIFELTQHRVSGETLKNLVGALAAMPVITALIAARETRYAAVDVDGEDELEIRWAKY